MKSYIAARAQLVTFILFVLEIYFIEMLLDTNKKKYGFALLAIAFLIVQLHCAVFPVFFVFAAPYVAEFVFVWFTEQCFDEKIYRLICRIKKKLTHKEDKKEILDKKIDKSFKNTEANKIKMEKRRNNPYKVVIAKNKAMVTLIIFLIIALLLGFLNPFGLGAYTYTYKIYKGNTTKSINEHLPLTIADTKGYAVVVSITLIILVLLDIKVRLSDLLMFGGTLFLAFKARRQVSLSIIMGMPLLAKFIASFFEKYDKNLCEVIKGVLTSVVGVILSLILVGFIGKDLAKEQKDQPFIDEFSYPVEASNFLKTYMKENNISKEDLKLYNEYNYGSYLLLNDIPVFIDSRCDLYTPEFNGDRDIFTDALSINGIRSDYEGIVKKYGVRHLILQAGDDVNMRLIGDSGFSKIYDDGNFVIYKKVDLTSEIEENN